MVSYYDLILAAIPALAVSGFGLRMVITVSGVGTGLLSIPLVPAGFLAALAVIARELFFGPVATHSDGRRG